MIRSTVRRKHSVFFTLLVLAVSCGSPIFAASLVVPTSAVSRKTHGDAGTFDVSLPLTGTPGIECRSGGASNAYQIVVTFPVAVTLGGASISSGTGSVSSSSVSDTTVTVNLTGVTNKQRMTVTLASVSDGTNSNDVIVPMSVLIGDTTANGTVNSSDIAQTQSQSGQFVTSANCREDVTVNGSINSSDIAFVQSKSGTALSGGSPRADKIATGLSSASLVLTPDSNLWSWGFIPGDGGRSDRSQPLHLTTISNIVSVSAGTTHATALASNGVIWSWGSNNSGQLGDGTTSDRNLPVSVLSNVISVKAGDAYTLALAADRTVFSWGANYYGQLGNGGTDPTATPARISGLTNVRSIAAGAYRSIAVKQDGTVVTWGYDHYDEQAGQDYYQLTPTVVANFTGVVDVAAGIDHFVALKSDGTVWTWGTNWNNVLGNGDPEGKYEASPVQVPGLSNVIAIASKADHTLALKSDGIVWAFGRNQQGQLGNGTTTPQITPVQVSGLTNVTAIVAAQWYSMAMTSGGNVWAWGSGSTALGLILDGSSFLTPNQTTLGLLDGDSDGMDDRWENDYFGNLDQTASGDSDGDGISNLQEYLNGTDPTDYYNGILPTMSFVGGDGQTADPETFLPAPLIVSVTKADGTPLVNAPVTFSNNDGLFSLANDGSSPLEAPITVRTNSSGQANVYFQTPAIVNDSTIVTATAQSGSSSVTVQFTEMTDTPPPPPAPSDVTATQQSDGSVVVTWVSHSTNEDAFVIKRQDLNGSWTTLAWADAGTTSKTIPPPTQPVVNTRNYEVGASKYGQEGDSSETNPITVRYTVIDLGTTLPPVRVTNSGYVLCTDGGSTRRWHNGQLESLTGGDPTFGAPYGLDINDSGTVVGEVSNFSYTGIGLDNFYTGGRGVILAAKWDAGQTSATIINPTTFSYHFEDPQPNGQPPLVYSGGLAGSSATTVDNDGHIYGTTLGGYSQQDAFTDDSGNAHPRIWGYWGGGWDFMSNAPLGTISFGLSADTYAFNGHDQAVQKVRNQTTFGYQTGDANGGYYHDPNIGPGYTFPGGTGASKQINGQSVSFTPVNLNSAHQLLGSGNLSPQYNWFIYDITNNTFTDLEVPTPIYFGPFPVSQVYSLSSLNRRQILTSDGNGQPVTKSSPQVLGGDYTLSTSAAMIWEENASTHHYESQYLSRLIPRESGWEIVDAYDINDQGVIAADGWYQPTDQNGNSTGPRQWRSCLLWPMKTTYVFLGASALSAPDYAGDRNEVFNNLTQYLDAVPYQADAATLQFLQTFDGPHSGATCKFAKNPKVGSELVRVFIYNCVTASRADGDVAKQAMKDALLAPGSYVTFNGHANMGAGPAFTLDVVGLSGFMQISARQAAAINALELQDEGYNFSLRPYVPNDPSNEVLVTGQNYLVPFFGSARFPNNDSVDIGEYFQLQVEGPTAYHYTYTSRDFSDAPPQTRDYTLVHVGTTDLPTLKYQWFYFDGCNTGRDYIENFEHGSFFYTTGPFGNTNSTKLFVKGIVDDTHAQQIVETINADDPDQQVNQFFPFQ